LQLAFFLSNFLLAIFLFFTIAEASRRIGVAPRLVRQQIKANSFPGAYRETTARGPQTGRWKIPLIDLLAAGYSFPLPAPDRNEASVVERESELERLRAELTLERERRIAAEVFAEKLVRAVEELERTSRVRELPGMPPPRPMPVQRRIPLRGNWLQ